MDYIVVVFYDIAGIQTQIYSQDTYYLKLRTDR